MELYDVEEAKKTPPRRQDLHGFWMERDAIGHGRPGEWVARVSLYATFETHKLQHHLLVNSYGWVIPRPRFRLARNKFDFASFGRPPPP